MPTEGKYNRTTFAREKGNCEQRCHSLISGLRDLAIELYHSF